jgi:predicted AAA+ superfamily ATPase
MLERTMTKVVEDISRGFRVLLLTGQRQVGKTTLLTGMAKDRRYVSLDTMKTRRLVREDPELFLQENPPPLIIDEVQYAPEIFPYIKLYVDTHKEDKGAFWLTGSQKFSLMQGVRESLAGRVAVLDLMGLSFREKMGQASSGGQDRKPR